jgi:diacylglycerol kinase (ATP)
MAKPGNVGIKRVVNATKFSAQGLAAAFKHEAAFRQEVALLIAGLPAAYWLGDTWVERAVLVCSILFVMTVELINSSIEAVVDRISSEHHELSGRAKDIGSAAVFVALTIAAIIWVSIGFS